MNRKRILAALLFLLGFVLAAGWRHAFGDGRSDLEVSISQKEGTPFYKIERKAAPTRSTRGKPR